MTVEQAHELPELPELPAKFRKKPIVIEAVQFTREMAEGSVPLPAGVTMRSRSLGPNGRFPEYANDGKFLINFSTQHSHFIETLEGNMDVQVGDWIITGVKGEHYPCKPDIFAATYEPASQPPAASVENVEAQARHVEVLQAIGSAFDSIPSPCEERDAINAAITALRTRSTDDLETCRRHSCKRKEALRAGAVPVDLKQFYVPVVLWKNNMASHAALLDAAGCNNDWEMDKVGEADRLLALIDHASKVQS